MNLKHLTFSHFEKLQNASLTLDHLFLLLQVEDGVDVQSLCKESLKLGALYQGIYRKGLITDAGALSLTGKEMIEWCSTPEAPETKPRRKAKASDEFEAWWKAYPGTDTFKYEGKMFSGTRSLRQKRDECKAKFNKILEEGEYTAQEMIDALEYEVLQKKENSLKEKTNKLKFMQNSLTYLNQRTFEPFIELIREGHKIIKTLVVSGGTDI